LLGEEQEESESMFAGELTAWATALESWLAKIDLSLIRI
jgi:hypothetical protein